MTGSSTRPDDQADGAPVSAGRWERHGARYLLVALLALVAWEAGATVWQHLAAVTDEDFAAAARVIAEQRKERSEPILFAPHWVEPLGLRHLARFVGLGMATHSDVDRFARVWEVSVRGARHPWLAGESPKRTWAAGRAQVALFERRPAEVLFDFYEHLATADVDRVGQDLVRCRREMVTRPGRPVGPRFVCDPRRSWNWVGWHLAEVGHRPYRCVFAQPVDGHRMRIAFKDVPLGRRLVLYTGIDDFENRKRANTPVLLEVYLDDQLGGTVRHLNEWPWHRFELDTASKAGKTATVRFEISSPLAFARTFCFTGDTRR